MANDHIADNRKKVRLIDADAFESEISKMFRPYGDGTYPGDYETMIHDETLVDVLETINEAPTVDAAPVVHAHWEDGCGIHNGKEVYKSIDCSHCNEIFKTEDREYWKKRFKVCPFCGAIMDGERREGK